MLNWGLMTHCLLQPPYCMGSAHKWSTNLNTGQKGDFLHDHSYNKYCSIACNVCKGCKSLHALQTYHAVHDQSDQRLNKGEEIDQATSSLFIKNKGTQGFK